MIPDAIINQIQDRVDIVEIIGAHVVLKRAGRNFKACCPFHPEKTPSFVVSPDKQIFHCFGCSAGGNVFGFLMKLEKKDFREVVETLAEQTGIEIPKDKAINVEATQRLALFTKANQLASDYYHSFLLTHASASGAREYLKKRGITEETIKNFKLGFSPDAWDTLYKTLKDQVPDKILESVGLVLARKEGGFYDRFRRRIIFPITDAKGACVAFGGRVMDDSLPKYMNSPESEVYHKGRHLYGVFQARKAIRDTDSAIIVEGYMDLIACHQAGVENVLASLGTALTPDQARLVKRHTRNVIMLYDADKAGEMATLRSLEIFLEEDLEVKIVRLEKGHDPDSYIKEFGAESFKKALSGAKTLFEYKLNLLKQNFDAKTLEGKVKIANEMVTLFSKVKNDITRSAWVKELAKELSLSEEALISEIRKGADKFKSPRTEAVGATVAKNPLNAVEKLLIGLWLEDSRFIVKAKDEILPEDFQNEKARLLAERMFLGNSSTVTAAWLINEFKDDTESIQIISQAAAELESLQDKEKTFYDCLLWLKRLRITKQRDHITEALTEAQKQGDKNRISKLLNDFNELNKGMKELNFKGK